MLLALAAGAAAAAAAIVWRDRGQLRETSGYYCPMHPEVRSAARGQCPICGMALEPVHQAPQEGTLSPGAMEGAADLVSVENIRKHKILDFVRMHALLFEQRELRGAALVESDGSITGVFYKDQAEALTPDDEGWFSPAASPEVSVPVRRTRDAALDWDRSTARVRFALEHVEPSAGRPVLEPGQVGWVELKRKVRNVLAVPASAILQSPEGPYVLRLVSGFKFEKRPIEIGETYSKQGFAVVLSGLRAQDRVVARAAFFIDADRRLGRRSDEDWVNQ